MPKIINNLLLTVIIFIALIFRIQGLNWDENQHLHPDERFITMVTQATKWPNSFSEYLNPNISPLNPYNTQFDFFVYGTLPLKIVKFTSSLITFDQFDYNNITLVGRLMSALFDIGTVFFVYKIASTIFNKKSGLLASFVYSVSVLPIQLSHFYAVDTFLVFFMTASFYFLTKLLSNKKPIAYAILMSTSFGFALASKVSAIFLLPFILITLLFYLLKYRNLNNTLIIGVVFSVFSYLSFRIADPRVFANQYFFDLSLNPQFVNNLKQLSSFSNPNGFFPPAIQWINTKPLIFPLRNIVLWGLGVPLGILTILATIFSICKQRELIKLLTKHRLKFPKYITVEQFLHLSLLVLIISLFTYQGIQFVKALRYFFPIYPFLAIITAYFLLQTISKLKQVTSTKAIVYFLISLFLLLLIYPAAFSSIYTKSNSRITASEWIYDNIPIGSSISCELWDDCLPLTLGLNNSRKYETVSFELFDPDSEGKWIKINSKLESVDYIIMSSNRLWGSIPRVPEKYPITSQFYNKLLAEEPLPSGLHFTKVAEFTSYPTIPFIGIELVDDSADETFTVYDHPKVLIFKKY